MMNAIKIGEHVINAANVDCVRLDECEGGPYIRLVSGHQVHFSEVAEMDAVAWWFAAADRVTFYLPGVTVDVVERHREHLEALAAADQAMPRLAVVPRPVVVCLCGSSRFRAAFEEANRNETLAGRIVLSIGMFGHHEGLDMDGPVKAALDDLHFRKIDLADSVFVLNVGGYIGYSTGREVAYARSLGKPIRFLEDPTVEMVETRENEGGAA